MFKRTLMAVGVVSSALALTHVSPADAQDLVDTVAVQCAGADQQTSDLLMLLNGSNQLDTVADITLTVPDQVNPGDAVTVESSVGLHVPDNVVDAASMAGVTAIEVAAGDWVLQGVDEVTGMTNASWTPGTAPLGQGMILESGVVTITNDFTATNNQGIGFVDLGDIHLTLNAQIPNNQPITLNLDCSPVAPVQAGVGVGQPFLCGFVEGPGDTCDPPRPSGESVCGDAGPSLAIQLDNHNDMPMEVDVFLLQDLDPNAPALVADNLFIPANGEASVVAPVLEGQAVSVEVFDAAGEVFLTSFDHTIAADLGCPAPEVDPDSLPAPETQPDGSVPSGSGPAVPVQASPAYTG